MLREKTGKKESEKLRIAIDKGYTKEKQIKVQFHSWGEWSSWLEVEPALNFHSFRVEKLHCKGNQKEIWIKIVIKGNSIDMTQNHGQETRQMKWKQLIHVPCVEKKKIMKKPLRNKHLWPSTKWNNVNTLEKSAYRWSKQLLLICRRKHIFLRRTHGDEYKNKLIEARWGKETNSQTGTRLKKIRKKHFF